MAKMVNILFEGAFGQLLELGFNKTKTLGANGLISGNIESVSGTSRFLPPATGSNKKHHP